MRAGCARSLRNPAAALRAISQRHWSEQTIIALVMQTRDNSITCYTKPGRFGRRTLTSTQGHGEPNPTWIPVGHDAVRRIARRIGGFPGGGWNDIFNIPMTAHFLGGAVIGDSADTGVIDPYHRVYGHPGLHVVDGAAISANLGVNPSLTITAQAERAMALWPNTGEDDRRPALGEPYRRVEPVAPRRPVVPASAPGALRLAVGKRPTRAGRPCEGGRAGRGAVDDRRRGARAAARGSGAPGRRRGGSRCRRGRRRPPPAGTGGR